MKLKRLYAYEVFPQKHETTREQPKGGNIPINAQLRRTLTRLITENKLETQTPIAFQVADAIGTSKGTNATRTALLGFAFGSGAPVKSHADALALKLSAVMDERSKPFLLLLSAFYRVDTSKVVLWAFPKDEGFTFAATPSGGKVEVISDIFNTSAALKKAALFQGEDSPQSFWDGRMVDIQSGRTNLWVESFLDCRLAVSGVYGTKMLADYVAQAYKRVTTVDAREQLFSAIVAVRTAPVRRMSCMRFANEYLSDEAKAVFLAATSHEQQSVSFDFDRGVFEEKLGFRAFKMEDDVFLTAPLATINASVHVDEGRLSYEGTIREEHLRSTSGRR